MRKRNIFLGLFLIIFFMAFVNATYVLDSTHLNNDTVTVEGAWGGENKNDTRPLFDKNIFTFKSGWGYEGDEGTENDHWVSFDDAVPIHEIKIQYADFAKLVLGFVDENGARLGNLSVASAFGFDHPGAIKVPSVWNGAGWTITIDNETIIGGETG